MMQARVQMFGYSQDCGRAIAAMRLPALARSLRREKLVASGHVHVGLLARVFAGLDGLAVPALPYSLPCALPYAPLYTLPYSPLRSPALP